MKKLFVILLLFVLLISCEAQLIFVKGKSHRIILEQKEDIKADSNQVNLNTKPVKQDSL